MSTERKPFYDELETSHKPSEIAEDRIHLPLKKSLYSQRWSFKPKQLI